jgi:hypothetical protein
MNNIFSIFTLLYNAFGTDKQKNLGWDNSRRALIGDCCCAKPEQLSQPYHR